MSKSLTPGQKLRGSEKILASARLIQTYELSSLQKPSWIRAKLPSGPVVNEVRQILRRHGLHSVCEEASCPNLGECFSERVATFMILGDICTRRCSFCDVSFGRPLPLDPLEPQKLASAVRELNLRFVVITSVNRDDQKDGGASQFQLSIRAIREALPSVSIEILTPDFRGRESLALETLKASPPDIFNHNLETIPRLYSSVRPGASYEGSLKLLQQAKEALQVPTKSGLMLGLGEADEEILLVLKDLYAHGVTRLTLGQYLRPSLSHLPVARYVSPETFQAFAQEARRLGFTHVASAPLVRSSYHAETQASL